MFFGIKEAIPERLPPRIHAGMIAFAWAVWTDRLMLFLGIAVLVYHFFIKDEEPTVSAPLRGHVHMDGERRSILGRALRAAAAVVIREWGA